MLYKIGLVGFDISLFSNSGLSFWSMNVWFELFVKIIELLFLIIRLYFLWYKVNNVKVVFCILLFIIRLRCMKIFKWLNSLEFEFNNKMRSKKVEC